MAKIWKIINAIAHVIEQEKNILETPKGSTNNPKEIADHFNNFCVKVRETLAKFREKNFLDFSENFQLEVIWNLFLPNQPHLKKWSA